MAQQEALYNKGKTTAETAYQQKIEQKRQALNSHPDFSGDNKAQSWASVTKAIEVFGTPELNDLLRKPEHGYDVNIALLLKKIGDSLQPENIMEKGKGVGTGKEAVTADTETARLQRLYPGLNWDK